MLPVRNVAETEINYIRKGEAQMTGAQELANAIILQAAKDYKAALRVLKRHPDNLAALAEIQEIESFFHSPWYAVLTTINPDYLIDRLRREAA